MLQRGYLLAVYSHLGISFTKSTTTLNLFTHFHSPY